MGPDNFLRGGALMLLASLLFSLSDTMGKYVTQTVPAVELATVRYAVFVAMAAVPYARRPRPPVRSRRPLLQLVRGMGVMGSALFFILSLGGLPIAEATAVNFVTPLVITLLAIPVLGEVVRPLGWAAVVAGFVGMLIVVRPGVHGLHPAALLVVASSLCWAAAMLVTRKLMLFDRSATTLLWTAGSGFVLLLCILPPFLHAMTTRETGLCLLVGVVASSAQGAAVLAYRHARATQLAPISYSQLIWSSITGYLVFGTAPDRWVWVGAAVIAGSGLLLVHGERVRVAALRTGAAT